MNSTQDAAQIPAPRPGDESAEVMVTVKTYPNPSDTYGETVCVAGVRIDRGGPEWIRLYPVKFRNTDFAQRFKKYERIKLNGTSHQSSDNRPESFRPRQDELEHIEMVGPSSNWALRRSYMGDLIGATSTCELIAANPKGHMALPSPSLGLIKPHDVKVEVRDGDPWTESEQRKIERASAPDLFGTELAALEPAPYAVIYHYKCAFPECRSHAQKALDWEVGAAGRRWREENGDQRAREMMMEKWRDELLDEDKDTHFYVGNQNRRRRSFSVLGLWTPKKEFTLF
ncbi:hypothetical protein GOEFS_077_00230 [Gordonia effusa NBRC 100432]|uniref:Uncharacterized protein n=1 Tax=Gordonia effusa NBRC 100432 TaxID=1077974 RepID=H0R2D0_9ACTN|nr:hypothetical protein [Gordonia effusa]GAB19231.1 hypothetical protein GOEFS_077_00230 [Gordonia effusa NBRC 100432]